MTGLDAAFAELRLARSRRITSEKALSTLKTVRKLLVYSLFSA